MELNKIDQILTRAIAEMAGHELETINRLEEGDVIRFPGHGIPADELAELEGLLKKKPSAETTQPSKREKTAPSGHPRAKISDLKRGEKIVIAPGAVYGDDYVVWRNQGDQYVAAVPGYGSKPYRSLRGPLNWLLRETEAEPHIQEKIWAMFDAKILKGQKPAKRLPEKPKVVSVAKKPGRLTSLNKGQTVMIHQGGKRKDWYMERTTAGTYVAVAGAKMQRSKTLEGALRWMFKQSQGGMQQAITSVFDLDAIKAGNAPPEESTQGMMSDADVESMAKVGYTERELIAHLKTLKDPRIDVKMLRRIYGKTPAAHTKFLQKLVKQGKLEYERFESAGGPVGLYRLPGTPEYAERFKKSTPSPEQKAPKQRELPKPKGEGIQLQPDTYYPMWNRGGIIILSSTKGKAGPFGYLEGLVTVKEYPFRKTDPTRKYGATELKNFIEKGIEQTIANKKRAEERWGVKIDKAEIARYKKMLAGERVKPDAYLWEPMKVIAIPAKKTKEDLWRRAEQYGNVGGIGSGETMKYEIETDFQRFKKLTRDRAFKIVKTIKL